MQTITRIDDYVYAIDPSIRAELCRDAAELHLTGSEAPHGATEEMIESVIGELVDAAETIDTVTLDPDRFDKDELLDPETLHLQVAYALIAAAHDKLAEWNKLRAEIACWLS